MGAVPGPAGDGVEVSERVLIVNADDFGRSPGVNRGVIRAHEHGVVTSASLMVRWPAAEEAAAYARGGSLSVGLHLDLGEWEYRDGKWQQRYQVLPKPTADTVAEEIGRQLELLEQLIGRPPTHLDSHQHVHREEPVRSALLRVGDQLGVPVRGITPGVAYSGSFYGQNAEGTPVPDAIAVESLVKAIETLPPGITELGCHPAAEIDHDSSYDRERVQELETLCDPRVLAAIDRCGITLRSFAEPTAPPPFNGQALPETASLRRVAERWEPAERTEHLAEPTPPAPVTRPAPARVEPIPAPPRVKRTPVPSPLKRVPVPSPARRWERYGSELLVAGVLVVIAFLTRRHGLPTNGLWLDDAVVGAGLNASLSQLLTVGSNNPGFIAALMGWSPLTGGTDAGLAYPAFIAGTLGPALLYLALRRFGYERSVSVLLAAALVAAETDIVYSGRVKTYTIDVLIVLGLAVIVPRFAQLKWRWQTGVAWTAAAVVVASFSPFALIAVAAAGAIIVLHPTSDLRLRIIAIGAQAVACLALLIAEGRTYEVAPIEAQWRQSWDAFLTFSPNPIRFGDEVLVHLRRVAEMFPGGPGWFAMLCILAALVGLAAIAWRGRQAIRARYLLLILGAAFLGGLFGKFPFGPTVGTEISSGRRVSLWLIPVVAIGLAAALQGLRGLLADRRALRVGFDTAAYLATAAILVSALADKALSYPWPGATSATHFVESQLGRHDAVLIPWPGHFSFAVDSDLSDGVQARADYAIGFWPMFPDPRLHLTGVGTEAPTPGRVAAAVKGADRVLVYIPDPFNSVERESEAAYARALPPLGFERRPIVHFGTARVEVWRRGEVRTAEGPRDEATAADRINLRLSDLPPGWQTASAPTDFSTALLRCLHVSTKADQSLILAMGTKAKSQLLAIAQTNIWPSTAVAQRAYAALSGPDAPGCIQSTTESAVRKSGFPASATVNEVRRLPAGGNRAVAYAESVATGRSLLGEGIVVLFTHKTAGVLISGISVGPQPFPRKLLSSLVATVAARVNDASLGGG